MKKGGQSTQCAYCAEDFRLLGPLLYELQRLELHEHAVLNKKICTAAELFQHTCSGEHVR